MFKVLVPKLKLDSIYDIKPELLQKKNIKLLLMDLDNTISPYSGSEPSEALKRWKEELISAGVGLFIVSNTRTDRAKRFAGLWGVPYVDHAKKPFSDTVENVIKKMGAKREETALVGDQIFTDVWAGNRAGILSIVVKPIELGNPFRRIRYWGESVFRAMGEKSF